MGSGERIFLVEDDDMTAELIAARLEQAGHVIAIRSKDLKDALSNAEKIQEIGATVAVVDLAKGKYADIHEDTHAVVRKIGEHVPGLPVVIYSSEHPGNVKEIHVSKRAVSGGGPTRLAEAISAIPR